MAKSITLYHGTDRKSAELIYTSGIKTFTGSKRTDFGPGFYTTPDYERARGWAIRKANTRGERAAVVTLQTDLDSAKDLIRFFSDDLEWGRFVINNRNGKSYIDKVPFKLHNLDHSIPITCGRIADLSVNDVADELARTGKMLMTLDKILNTSYPLQYVFHTDRSLQYILGITYRNI